MNNIGIGDSIVELVKEVIVSSLEIRARKAFDGMSTDIEVSLLLDGVEISWDTIPYLGEK